MSDLDLLPLAEVMENAREGWFSAEKVDFQFCAQLRASSFLAGITYSEAGLAGGRAEVLGRSGCLGTCEERYVDVVRGLIIEKRVEYERSVHVQMLSVSVGIGHVRRRLGIDPRR